MGFKKANNLNIHMNFASTNMGDLNDYFFGVGTSMSTSALLNCAIVPFDGVITSMSLYTNSATDMGTAENISVYLRLNDTTDYLIEQVGIAAAVRKFVNYNLNIPVKRGDTFEGKVTTPAWVTNPTATRGIGIVVLTY